jgi:hypothetical protein
MFIADTEIISGTDSTLRSYFLSSDADNRKMLQIKVTQLCDYIPIASNKISLMK